jgi:hypothetical protein
MEQKYRDHGTKKRNKASTKEQIEFKRGTKIQEPWNKKRTKLREGTN